MPIKSINRKIAENEWRRDYTFALQFAKLLLPGGGAC
jgi:hypothetical protein